MTSVLGQQDRFDAVEVFLGVYADGVECGFGYIDGDVVFEEAELFEALGEFERAGREGVEEGQRGGSVGVDTEMFPDGRVDAVTVVWKGGAREVEGSAVERGDDLDGVGVVDVVRRAADLECGDLGGRGGERGEQRSEVFGTQERLVSLDVDVDVCGVVLGDGVDAVGAAGEIGAGHDEGPRVVVAERGDFFGVGGDEDGVELRAGAGGVVDPGEHWPAGDFAKNLARESG